MGHGTISCAQQRKLVHTSVAPLVASRSPLPAVDCARFLQDITALVEAGQAVQMSLNPVTKANTEKAVQRVIAQNGLALAPQAVTAIADAANGDLHNALETLQLMCAGAPLSPAAAKAKKGSQVCHVLLM